MCTGTKIFAFILSKEAALRDKTLLNSYHMENLTLISIPISNIIIRSPLWLHYTVTFRKRQRFATVLPNSVGTATVTVEALSKFLQFQPLQCVQASFPNVYYCCWSCIIRTFSFIDLISLWNKNFWFAYSQLSRLLSYISVSFSLIEFCCNLIVKCSCTYVS